MPYSSSLTDKEWELIEPLMPSKKKTRPPKWTKRQILDGVFYQLKNGCNWCDLPKDLPPYSTVFWHYKQWGADGILEAIMQTLHAKVRQQAKKNQSGHDYWSLTRKRWRIRAMPVLSRKGSVITNVLMASSVTLRLIHLVCRFLLTALKLMWAMTKVWLNCWTTT